MDIKQINIRMDMLTSHFLYECMSICRQLAEIRQDGPFMSGFYDASGMLYCSW